MKVAIVTHSLRFNYGGILQNFAMQRMLNQIGCEEVMTLKLGRKGSYYKRLISLLKYFIKKYVLGRNVDTPLSSTDIDLICTNTDIFINKYIKMSPKMGMIDKKWVNSQNFDAIVVGSDQVLNPSSYKKIEDIYLSFSSCPRKLMIAASFGGKEQWNYSSKQTDECKALIRNFSFVGVRENIGATLMQNYFGQDVEVVLDPTLMIEKEVYLKLLPEYSGSAGLVTYLLDDNENKQKLVTDVAQHLSLTVSVAGNPMVEQDKAKLSERVVPGVEEWLTKMAYADFIITDSYHGTLFAIIFNKPFITILNKKRGSDRFYTILTKLGLENRILADFDPCNIKSIINSDIDYRKVNIILKEKCDSDLLKIRKALNL